MARDVLELLASVPRGLSAAVLAANGLISGILAGLVREGLAMTEAEVIGLRGQAIEVFRIRITDAGRRALEGERVKPPRATNFRFLCDEILQLSS
jgi:hypothetical protein